MEGGDKAGQQLASRQIKERIAVMQRGVGGIVKGQRVDRVNPRIHIRRHAISSRQSLERGRQQHGAADGEFL